METTAGRQEGSGGTVGPQGLLCMETPNLSFYQGEKEDYHETLLLQQVLLLTMRIY